MKYPEQIQNWIGGEECPAGSGEWVQKMAPGTGEAVGTLARSGAEDVSAAVQAAREAQSDWGETSPVRRGEILRQICRQLEDHEEQMAEMVALETGKALSEAIGEVRGALALGYFYAGEGQRLYGRTTTSGVPGRAAMTIRVPVGVAALVVAANTPIANVAWKVFPALIGGNSVVMKAAEDTPGTALLFAQLTKKTDLPAGVLNVIQGLGREAGAALVDDDGIDVISFTGSSAVGKEIAEKAARRLLKVSLELGGKNPLVVCDDADLDRAVRFAVASSFSNAGQRCAASSRIIVMESVYEKFRDLFLKASGEVKADAPECGPVINERQMNRMLEIVAQAKADGATVLLGGSRADLPGYFVEPTILENVSADSAIHAEELFGPVTCLYRVAEFEGAMREAANSPYALTASIHTNSVERSQRFIREIPSGSTTVNGPTHGSEPHMPFGGQKQSGNGTREPGTEALDIYTDLRNVYTHSQ